MLDGRVTEALIADGGYDPAEIEAKVESPHAVAVMPMFHTPNFPVNVPWWRSATLPQMNPNPRNVNLL